MDKVIFQAAYNLEEANKMYIVYLLRLKFTMNMALMVKKKNI